MIKFGKWQYTHTKGLLLLLLAMAVVVIGMRLFGGLGAVTNLNDSMPWGLWKAFDVIVVVPLGASGFTMAFVRYVLKDERYEYIMRRSVVWAAIMYLSMGLRLMFDIGLPWRLPNPLVLGGNIHSPLFEVAWCVALYLIVLMVENIPRVTERMSASWAHKFEHGIHFVAPAFVLFGILLSSMHQSTLGTLNMAFGRRVDALWYHPWLNYIYLLTAIAAGLSVTILLEHFSNRMYKTEFKTDLLSKLAWGVSVPLAIAGAWRVYVLAIEGNLGMLAQPRLATYLWWLEMLVGYVLPLAVLATKAGRSSRNGLVLASAGTVLGMMALRLNVNFTAMWKALNASYTPSMGEWIFTIGITAGTLVIFTILAETLPGIIEREKEQHTEVKAVPRRRARDQALAD